LTLVFPSFPSFYTTEKAFANLDQTNAAKNFPEMGWLEILPKEEAI